MTVTERVAVRVEAPAAFETRRLIEYVPARRKTWRGFCSVEIEPSPKVHRHSRGEPDEVSVNWTASGAGPDRGAARNDAAGFFSGAVTVTWRVRTETFSPPGSATRRVTLYRPGAG